MARLDIVFTGYVGDRVAGTISLVRDGGITAIVDPGMVPDRSAILDPLRELDVDPAQVTDVILSHHHPDHTINIALFPEARVHDHWAIYHRDRWEDRPAEGTRIGDAISLIETPGHTPQDITTLVETDDGTVALTHLWWNADVEGDPRAWDLDRLRAGRERVLGLADRIVPGHGAPFAAADAPRMG